MSARHTRFTNWLESLRLKRKIAKFLKGYYEGKDVFELGFGIGRMTGKLAKKAREVVAVDPSEKMYQKATEKLRKYTNISLKFGKITDYDPNKMKFDLVFESIVLLHILNPGELTRTAERMKELCANKGYVFLCEHVWEEGKSEGSKFSIFRKPEEYVELLRPFELKKVEPVRCAGDLFMLYLFERK